MPQARRSVEAVGAIRVQARAIAGGREPELALAVSSLLPLAFLVDALRAFRERFPSVTPRIHVEALGGVASLVEGDICPLGTMVAFVGSPTGLHRYPLSKVELVMVAAPAHPLAALKGRLSPEVLRDHVQLVLTSRGPPDGNRDYGVYATQAWRIADRSAKHAILRAGLGFGSMPLHLVAEDLQLCRLVRLHLTEWEGPDRAPFLPVCVAHRTEAALGPATRWMLHHLTEAAQRATGVS